MGKHAKGGFGSKRGLCVEVRGSFDSALKLFSRKVKREGLMHDLRKKEYYEQPSAKRRREKIEARVRWLKAQPSTK